MAKVRKALLELQVFCLTKFSRTNDPKWYERYEFFKHAYNTLV